MGLRFRKSISLGRGAKINFGTSSLSFSFGVPGLRKTIHTSGRTTTSIGIPGTGLYYTKTENYNTQPQSYSESNESQSVKTDDWIFQGNTIYNSTSNMYESYRNNENNYLPIQKPIYSLSNELICDKLKNIHKVCDELIDWTEVLVSKNPSDVGLTKQQWDYYHSQAGKVLNGDIETFLKVITEVNPLDDLLQYSFNFEFGTDDPNKIEVELILQPDLILKIKEQMISENDTKLLQECICSLCIRVARDMISLLPVKYVVIHIVDKEENNERTILSAACDRHIMNYMNFNFINTIDAVERFNHNMNYSPSIGFSEIERIDI